MKPSRGADGTGQDGGFGSAMQAALGDASHQPRAAGSKQAVPGPDRQHAVDAKQEPKNGSNTGSKTASDTGLKPAHDAAARETADGEHMGKPGAEHAQPTASKAEPAASVANQAAKSVAEAASESAKSEGKAAASGNVPAATGLQEANTAEPGKRKAAAQAAPPVNHPLKSGTGGVGVRVPDAAPDATRPFQEKSGKAGAEKTGTGKTSDTGNKKTQHHGMGAPAQPGWTSDAVLLPAAAGPAMVTDQRAAAMVKDGKGQAGQDQSRQDQSRTATAGQAPVAGRGPDGISLPVMRLAQVAASGGKPATHRSDPRAVTNTPGQAGAASGAAGGNASTAHAGTAQQTLNGAVASMQGQATGVMQHAHAGAGAAVAIAHGGNGTANHNAHPATPAQQGATAMKPAQAATTNSAGTMPGFTATLLQNHAGNPAAHPAPQGTQGASGGAAAANPYARMDEPQRPTLVYASPQKMSVAVSDPALGSFQVRAQSSGSQMAASLATASAATHAQLSGQLPALNAFLQEQRVDLARVTVVQQNLLGGDSGPRDSGGQQRHGRSGSRQARAQSGRVGPVSSGPVAASVNAAGGTTAVQAMDPDGAVGVAGRSSLAAYGGSSSVDVHA